MSRVRAPSPALGRWFRNGAGTFACLKLSNAFADVAQLVEHTLGKGEVTGSIPVVSSDGWMRNSERRCEAPERGTTKQYEQTARATGGASDESHGLISPLSTRPSTRSVMPRDKIILACGECKNRNYFTTKNKRLHPERVEWKKYCPRCNKHQVHKETK
jgi:large subunit ribosomal protein L33